MPAKKTKLTDAERAQGIREAARELETSNDPADFERAFAKVVSRPLGKEKDRHKKKPPS